MDRTVLVYGASGHTGGFVLTELRRLGWRPVLGGRDAGRLATRARAGETILACDLSDTRALVGVAASCAALLNCAGPFEDTAPPLAAAALEAGTDYLDITAGETSAVAALVERFDAPARAAGIRVLPSASFYGGLGDLLATAAAAGWDAADEINVAVALDNWQPTPGTRAVLRRAAGRRMILNDGRLELRTGAPAIVNWTFPHLGTLPVMADYPGPESVLTPRHLGTRNVRLFLATAALQDLTNPDSPPPTAADESGRSAQRFTVHTQVVRAGQVREAWASGRDIYAVTAPILVQAMEWTRQGRAARSGVLSLGEAFPAAEFLSELMRRVPDFHFEVGQ